MKKRTREIFTLALCLVILSGLVAEALTYCPRCKQHTLEQDGEPETAYYVCGLKKEELYKYTCTHCVNPSHSEYKLVRYGHSDHEVQRTDEDTCPLCGQVTKVKVVICEGDRYVTKYIYPPHEGCTR